MDIRLAGAGWLLAGIGLIAAGSASAQSATQTPTLSPIQTLVPAQQETFPGPPGTPPTTLYFGAALAVHGGTALIGMPGYPNGRGESSPSEGAVAVFVRRVGVWQRAATLRPDDPAAHDSFGEDVALDRNIAAVKAESGIYVFRRTSSGWQQLQKLVPPSGVLFDGGIAVGDATIFVGASAQGQPGAVLVFESDMNGAWQPVQTLTSGEPAGSDDFGGEIAVSGTTLVVGAAGEDDGAGAAFAFQRGPSGWSQQQKLLPSDAPAGAAFGSAVAISHRRIVIGAPEADPQPSANCAFERSGAIYVFTPGSGAWQQQAKIAAPAVDCAASFGTRVAIGNGQVVGVTPSLFPYQLGGSYVYRRDGQSYAPLGVALDSSLVSRPVVAISAGVLFVGMPADRGFSTGTVELYGVQ